VSSAPHGHRPDGFHRYISQREAKKPEEVFLGPSDDQKTELPAKNGAHDQDRTGDLILTKNVLYQLSYVGELTSFNPRLLSTDESVVGAGFEPA
jgi:hypothetical protein